ncbi:hypothetical protein ACHAXS_004747 [Conticribra weissflogii]
MNSLSLGLNRDRFTMMLFLRRFSGPTSIFCCFIYCTLQLTRCNVLLADVHEGNLSATISECRRIAPFDVSIEATICDVTNKSQVRCAVQKADDLALVNSNCAAAKASILVNSAGITKDAKISNLSDADWDNVLGVNLKGTFLMCQAFCNPDRLANMGDCLGGSIINIGSIVSKCGNIGQVNYASSKGGVVGLTRSLAKEMASLSLRSSNETIPIIRVNCIQPGFIQTQMVDTVPEGILLELENRIVLKRLGLPEDIANLALFLASHRRSGYITGEVMECSGMLRF